MKKFFKLIWAMRKLILILILLCMFGCGYEEVTVEGTEEKIYVEESWSSHCEKYGKEYLNASEKNIQNVRDILYPFLADFTYKSDYNRWGHDQWDMLDNGEGDCEDFAITLRDKLIDNGFRITNVGLAMGVRMKNGTYSGHMVCVVKLYLGKKYVIDYGEIIPIENYEIFWNSKLDESGLYWVKYYGEAKEVKIEY